MLAEPMRLIVSASAVAVSLMLVIFFSAVFEGESEKMVVYLEEMNADVWVMQKGVSNMHMASSMVWDWKAEKVAGLPGVKDSAAILYFNGPVKIGGKHWFSYVIGLKPQMRRAGPWAMAEGEGFPGPGEAVIPEVISKLTGIGLGDVITLVDQDLKVVGLSRETFSMSSALVFVSHEDLGRLLEGRDQYSYVMVYADEGISAESLAQGIEAEIGKVNAIPSDIFIASDRDLALQMGSEIIQMMTLIGTLLATVIVAFTAYTQVARKRRELAIIKALGFSPVQIYGAALFQSLAVIALALLLTFVLSYTVLAGLPALAPQINLAVRLRHFLSLVLLAVPMAVLASLGAARMVQQVDPVTVFQD